MGVRLAGYRSASRTGRGVEVAGEPLADAGGLPNPRRELRGPGHIQPHRAPHTGTTQMQGHAAITASDQPHDALGIAASQSLYRHHPVRPTDVTAHEAAPHRTATRQGSTSTPSTIRHRSLPGARPYVAIVLRARKPVRPTPGISLISQRRLEKEGRGMWGSTPCYRAGQGLLPRGSTGVGSPLPPPEDAGGRVAWDRAPTVMLAQRMPWFVNEATHRDPIRDLETAVRAVQGDPLGSRHRRGIWHPCRCDLRR